MKATKKTLLPIAAVVIAISGYWIFTQFNAPAHMESSVTPVPEEQEISREKSKKARSEYFFRMLRNPETNKIPQNIRAREINHAKHLPTFRRIQSRKKAKNPSMQVAEGFDWQLAGPHAIGGRTRALGIDERNSNIIIAGGVSGGIWKSTDGGTSWDLKTGGFENFSVTSLAQHPINQDTWYYTSGEIQGNSAGATGASYYGTGIFRSTDNGESWSRISSTADRDSRFDTQFDYISRIDIHPTSGAVYTANNGFGIFRSANGDNFDNIELGGAGEHYFSDFDIASNGDVIAVLSSTDAGVSSGNPGIFLSTDDGQNWTEITPSDFPSEHARSVISFAPSNPNIAYVFTNKVNDDTNQGFFKLDISGGVNNVVAEDRSANLPDFGNPVGGVNLQGGYNMTVSVKPDNPDFVTIGATNLFRSTNGFSTEPSNTSSEKDAYWVGGYSNDNNVSQYPNQHPDQHVQVYDPNDPNKLWVGHDGGISVTNDVSREPMQWTDRNETYVVTQFYDISIAPEDGKYQLLGGTQDNGTPFFEYDLTNQTASTSVDISSGDGGFSFWGTNYAYASSQRGRILRIGREADGSISSPFDGNTSTDWASVHPEDASDQLFIHPYTVDPNDEGIMYYPDGGKLYRNTKVDENNPRDHWQLLPEAEMSGFNISALAVSTLPANVLYYAGSNDSNRPKIMKIDNANSSNIQPVDVSISNAAQGAYVNDIAINPNNGNEALVVLSNYGIVGLYHTVNGGESWEPVEGNLEGSDDVKDDNAGPSMRSVAIIPATSGTIYVLGTSTGVYATQGLNGNQTQWGRESEFDGTGSADIGYSVVENIDWRRSDGDLAIGSHGRGIFIGDFKGKVAASNFPFASISATEVKAGDEVTVSATNFQFSTQASENTVEFNGIKAKVKDATSSELTVIVPRGTTAGTSDVINGRYPVTVSVENYSGDKDPEDLSISIIAPSEFKVRQNYPNPFNPSTTIPIDLPDNAEFMRISIYNMAGQKVREKTLNDKNKLAVGTPNIKVNMNDLASGVYIYRVYVKTANDDALQTKKMTLVK
ncbi:T9SS type A sorting domain-containing protein [Aliifodinibius halophilus]|uniref:T9SS type A sorting domain-containing protein n=1 Tax=Fodinibius halophilus TaxID=1736908 RepID=A0A6M1T944_9BACT|nr:T9SS type A sorting domain-containing protein [Fodinibius halophilus]